MSDDDLNARARRWLDEVANVRVHGTLGERIDDRFARGAAAARPPGPASSTDRSCRGPGLWTHRLRCQTARAATKVEVERRPLGDHTLWGDYRLGDYPLRPAPVIPIVILRSSGWYSGYAGR